MTSHSHIAKETKGEAQPAQEQIHNSDNNSATFNTAIERKQGNRLPETLDAYGWVALSDKLKTERRRVLEDLDNHTPRSSWSSRSSSSSWGLRVNTEATEANSHWSGHQFYEELNISLLYEQ
ncbi:hypothetical protein J7T55_010136 [Diaporthe amygdali]|uniref:uncharacterized protein n=1 Tax=Phomopsis amygdali TaxID=1214568 RepID=UPI0022FE0F8D|nr:uncharacterized protein J7T55_010136 [Diaporthe amygdali]KAJ0113892.1 hypothetical protein J7T55_010136 [Diaporthe amygdali]